MLYLFGHFTKIRFINFICTRTSKLVYIINSDTRTSSSTFDMIY